MKIKKHFIAVATSGLALAAAVFIFVSLAAKEAKVSEESLPVFSSTASYPEFTLSELTQESEFIVYARIAKTGDSISNPIYVSYSGEIDAEPDDVLYFPETPINVEIINAIKGNTKDGLVYLQDGGRAKDYILLPSGHQLEENMEVILFLNEYGKGWGGLSEFLVFDDNVVLKADTLKEFGEKRNLSASISQLPIDSLPNSIYKALYPNGYLKERNIDPFIENDYVYVCNKDDFINLISSLGN